MSGVLREAIASARSQAVASTLTVVMVAGMCVAVLLTTGRVVAAERAALAQIDAAGTRTVTVRAAPDAGVTTAVIGSLQRVSGVESIIGFGPIVDTRNAAIPGGPRVPVRRGYGTIGQRRFSPAPIAGNTTALASVAGAEALGLRDGTGGLRTDDGHEFVVVGTLDVPAHLRFLEPLVVIPAGADDGERQPLAVLVVLARTPAAVAAVETVVRSLLRDVDPAKATVETSAQLAAIRAAVSGQLGRYGRGTVLGIIAISVVLVAVNLFALVAMRRKDFGRRRALGARRSLVIQLLLTQVGLLAAVGVALGTAGALIGLALTGGQLPGPGFSLAVAMAGVLSAVLAATLPAYIAAHRDPLHELRVP